MKFTEVKKDYLELIREHGAPYDMTGGFVDAGEMIIVILNPTKKNAVEYLENVISYGFGFKDRHYRNVYDKYISIDECDIVKRIYDKYINLTPLPDTKQ